MEIFHYVEPTCNPSMNEVGIKNALFVQNTFFLEKMSEVMGSIMQREYAESMQTSIPNSSLSSQLSRGIEVLCQLCKVLAFFT